LFPLFATGVIDTGGKFSAGVVDTGGKLPPVSLIPVANLPPVSTTLAKLVANLPPVLLIPVAILRISPRIFEKIRNGPNGILWGCGETDSWKKPEAKNLVTLSLYIVINSLADFSCRNILTYCWGKLGCFQKSIRARKCFPQDE
jgi:hypothetical protein